METPHLPEPRQEGAAPSPGTEATATAVPQGPPSAGGSLPVLTASPWPAPGTRARATWAGWRLGSRGLGVLASLSNELSPVCPQGLGCVCLSAGFSLWRPLGEGDKDNTKWPPWPTVCCQKPTVPSQPASGKPVALCGGRGGDSGRGQAPAQPAGEAGCGAGGSGSGTPTPPRSTTRELLTVCSRPERYWEPPPPRGAMGGTGDGCGGQAAPPPTYQCPPLSGRSWPLLPL